MWRQPWWHFKLNHNFPTSQSHSHILSSSYHLLTCLQEISQNLVHLGFFYSSCITIIVFLTSKYIARNDDSDIHTCIRYTHTYLSYLCSQLYRYPIDTNAVYQGQFLKKFWTLAEKYRSSIIFSEGYNVHKHETIAWFIIVSVPLHVTNNYATTDTKTVVLNKNSIITLQPTYCTCVGISNIQVEPQKLVNISDSSYSVLTI